MTIEALALVGAIIGFLAALLIANFRIGCAGLWIIPIAMIVVVIAEQRLHPENVRSTSALDFVFVPLWPSLGALAGYAVGRLMRSVVAKVRKRTGS
ncbi:hypothetical protein [Sphingomonas antarctica]|uniref:hypothetical protein n=1 Tax=Sphingomonas antarctica TaxID=2040274 RepID=UPI0039ED385D